MNLSDRIRVQTRYTRSTNVERDRDSQSIVEAYIPTSRGVSLLTDVTSALEPEDRPRAWSLIGPYGSGKSSFALFLNQLLADSKSPAGQAALNVLRKENSGLAKAFRSQGDWCRVMITGAAEPLSTRLVAALGVAAQKYWGGKRGRKPAVLKALEDARTGKPTTQEILELVDALQDAVEKSANCGLLIVIDELGKFLEYEARHYGANDIFLLQGLAERALSGRKANILLFVLLHQGFDLYARGLGESLKNDWAKVQGRFQSIPFVETTEQTLRVIASAFKNELPRSEQSVVDADASRIAASLAAGGGLPGLMTEEDAAQLFSQCYPLHPVALLTLPLLCQKFAQNERTLFSYLGSQEPHGFKYSLERLAAVGDWIRPSEVYDYFIQNQPAVLADPLTHRRWAEVVTAVERAHSLGPIAEELSKSIGLLNLTSSSEGLKATTEVIRCLYRTDHEAEDQLRILTDASVIQYRKFSREYRVWQGTDFNIDEATHTEAAKIGNFDLAPTLSERFQSVPLVARRHSTQTGALRWFDVEYVDARSFRNCAANPHTPSVIFFISEGQDDEHVFRDFLDTISLAPKIAVLFRNGSDIRAAINEVLALEGVQHSAQALASDPVASREVSERLKAARIAEQEILNTLISNPRLSDWYWQGQRIAVNDRRAMQNALSDAMDAIYSESPILRNELINRDRLSSQAAAARNRLLNQMLNASTQPGLGIEKYPPERAIYRSIFEAGKLHAPIDGTWRFVAPHSSDPLNLAPTWQAIDRFFEASEAGPQAVDLLMDQLRRPPYGLKTGIFSLVFLHYYLLHNHEIALYEDGIYSPTLTYEHLERLVRRPENFSFQRFRIEGVRASLFDQYSKALFGGTKEGVDLLGIARPLTKFMLDLDDYAKKTKRLSETTLKVRQAFFLSKSPEKLLFEELPAACGFKSGDPLAGFDEALIACLRELNRSQAKLLDELRGALCDAFAISQDTDLSELRTLLRGRCHGLERYTVDVKGLKSFIRRLTERTGSDEEWFRALLLFLGHVPSQKWTDQDRDTAEYRLSQFSRRLLDLEKLRLHHESHSNSDLDLEIHLLRSLKNGEEVDEVVTIGRKTAAAVTQSRDAIQQIVEQIKDPELRLALIAQLAHDVLVDYRASQRKNKETADKDDQKRAG